MKKSLIIMITALTLIGCDTKGVEKGTDENVNPIDTATSQVNVLDSEQEIVEQKKLPNGITIKWFEHGSGAKLKHGDCVDIDYKVQLDDGVVVDGNHLINKESIPFIIGFGMQTEGWDIALKELLVGDFVEIFIPSNLARGEKGIKDLIPPNADNVLRIRIIERNKPTREIDGNKVWVFEENPSNEVTFSEKNEIEFHCVVSSPSSPRYANTYRDNNPFRLRLEDGGLVPGLKKALINAKKADRMFVFVPSSEGYGAKGYQDLVKPGEDILYNVLVMHVTDK
jgi:FKBP-type peptidyl-prolyl cis-trans isomerase